MFQTLQEKKIYLVLILVLDSGRVCTPLLMPHILGSLQMTENEGKTFFPVFCLNVAVFLLGASPQLILLESTGHAVWLIASSCNYLQNPLQSFCSLWLWGRECRCVCFFLCVCFFCVAIYSPLFNQVSSPLWDQFQFSPFTLPGASPLRTFLSCQTSQSTTPQVRHLHTGSYARSCRSRYLRYIQENLHGALGTQNRWT